jgi:hypothetical protein
MRCAWIVSVLTSIVLGLATPSPAVGNEMVIAFDGVELRAEEVTPGADVAWFSISRERSGERTRVVRRHGLERDGDGDGVISVILEDPAAPHSVWVVVDLGSGAWRVWQPVGFPIGELELPDDALAGSGEAPRALRLRHRAVDMVLFRPGGGAWWSAAGDGGGGDQDRSINGVIEMAFGQMVPLDGAPVAPGALAAGDLLLVIDPRSLATAVRQYISTVD